MAGAQIDIGLADKNGNLRKFLNCCREADEKGARIVRFPELTLIGYNGDSHTEIQPIGGLTGNGPNLFMTATNI